MSATINLLALSDVLRVASAVHAMPEAELKTEVVVGRAGMAVDAQMANVHADPFQRLVGATSQLCAVLLRRPPLEADPAKLAYACSCELLSRNHAHWTADERVVVLKLTTALREQLPASVLAEWVAQNITPRRRRRRPVGARQDERLFVPDGLPERIAVYLGGPLASLSQRQADGVRELNRFVREGLTRGVSSWTRPIPIELVHPSLDLPRGEPAEEAELTELTMRRLSEDADVLVLCDIDTQPPGFGAALELATFSRTGPVLYLRSERCPVHSRFLAGLSGRYDLTVSEFTDPSQIVGVVRQFFVDHEQEILDGCRRRHDCELLYGGLQTRLKRAWDRMGSEQHRQIARWTGLPIEAIDRIVLSPIGLAKASLREADALCRALNVERDDQSSTRRVDRDINWPALLAVAEEDNLDIDTVLHLRDQAVLAVDNARARLARVRRFATEGDWRRLLRGHER